MAQGGVILTFDPALDAAVRERRELLARRYGDIGPAGIPPHITLVIADDLDQAAWEAGLAELAAAEAPIPVHLSAVASFFGPEGVVYLAPSVTPALARMQSRALELARRAGSTPTLHVLEGAWMPHCTLAVGLDDQLIGPAIADLRADGVVLEGHAVALVPFILDGDHAVTGPTLPLAG